MNPFLDHAERTTPAPVARRQAAVAKRAATKQAGRAEQELHEEELLSKLYRKWKREQIDKLLAGPYGKDVRGIVSFMRTMTLSSAPALIQLVERATWVKALGADDRHVLLGMIGRTIARIREREGLAPFDDGVIGEPHKAFHQIKDILGCR